MEKFDLVIVGAGFAGMYGLHKFREKGLRVRVFEAGTDVGGTWYWNRYPGARCDVPSIEYSFGFSDELEQEWDWPEVFSAQPDILKYANQQIAIAPEHNDQTEAENVANIRASLDMQNNSIQSAVENPRRTNSVETNDSDAGVFSDTSSVS